MRRAQFANMEAVHFKTHRSERQGWNVLNYRFVFETRQRDVGLEPGANIRAAILLDLVLRSHAIHSPGILRAGIPIEELHRPLDQGDVQSFEPTRLLGQQQGHFDTSQLEFAFFQIGLDVADLSSQSLEILRPDRNVVERKVRQVLPLAEDELSSVFLQLPA